ncbi:succinate dehydrogenase assembly factor 2 [Beggiatoa alba]|nr:succinate dehydrogenase assembly factor 2 [Beggiatoa alba]
MHCADNSESDVELRVKDPHKKRRIRWQCRRGMLELDAMLQGFLDWGYDALAENEHAHFENLLNCHDNLLLEYLMGRTVPVDPDIANVVTKIRAAAQAAT